jgi:3-oxoacyl-(acyl-carrier-protein) synthase III
MIPVRIRGTAALVAGRRLTTDELAGAATPGRPAAEVVARTGIASRWWVEPDETVAGLGVRVLRRALAEAALAPADLRRLVLVCSTGGDVLIPATANAILAAAGVAASCDAFDLNNACMGFLSAFDVAARTVATGRHPVAVVVVETLSRFVAPDVPRPYLVLGDAAAAVILGPATGGEGIVGGYLANDGRHRGSVSLAHPGLTGRRERIAFAASSREITEAAVGALVVAGTAAAAEAGLSLERVEWVVPHQPNGAMLDQLVTRLGIDPGRMVRSVHEIGSVGAASMPFGLDRLLRERPVGPAEHVLMLGVGAGMASGAVVYRTGS